MTDRQRVIELEAAIRRLREIIYQPAWAASWGTGYRMLKPDEMRDVMTVITRALELPSSPPPPPVDDMQSQNIVLRAALQAIIDAADEFDAPHWSVRLPINEARELLERS